MNDSAITIGKLKYNFMFYSKIKAHFCVVNVESKILVFCFDWDIPNKKVFNFLNNRSYIDSTGTLIDDNYPIDPGAIKYMEKIFNLRAFF